MRYGNTLRSIRGGIVTTGILGIAVAATGLAAGIAHHTIDRLWPVCFWLFGAPPLVFVCACLPTLVFSIRIEEGRVRHVMLDRFILSDFPASDFMSMTTGNKPWAVVLRFTDSRKIRFLGAHLGVIGQLRAALAEAKKRSNRGERGRLS